jgi:hypothetical protein
VTALLLAAVSAFATPGPALLDLHVSNGSVPFAGDQPLLTTVSPNDDGFRDSATVRFRLTRPVQVRLEVVATNMVSAMNTYLLTPLKADMESEATTASGVLADLIALMVTDLETVKFSGVFWTFFDEQYEQNMNSNGAGGETIADSLAL